jgi:hypothetical protein
LAKLFGFVQFDFAGTLPLADGRYLAGEPGSGEEAVLVLQRLGAPPHAERRRRRGRSAPADPDPALLSLTRATAIRAASPFENQAQAARWLDEACEAEDTADALAAEAIAILNRALHTQAVAATDPYGRQLTPEQAERVLLGYGSGDETADGQFTDARQIDLTPRTASRRRQREEELRPQERVAAILRGREQLDACETLLLRARVDLDAGREREAALQLRVGLEALLDELDGAVDDPGHEQDLAALRERQAEPAGSSTEDTLAICERVLRRRRVLRS